MVCPYELGEGKFEVLRTFFEQTRGQFFLNFVQTFFKDGGIKWKNKNSAKWVYFSRSVQICFRNMTFILLSWIFLFTICNFQKCFLVRKNNVFNYINPIAFEFSRIMIFILFRGICISPFLALTIKYFYVPHKNNQLINPWRCLIELGLMSMILIFYQTNTNKIIVTCVVYFGI